MEDATFGDVVKIGEAANFKHYSYIIKWVPVNNSEPLETVYDEETGLWVPTIKGCETVFVG